MQLLIPSLTCLKSSALLQPPCLIMWLKGLWVIIATLCFCFQETICYLSHLDILLVMQTNRAADAAKTHSCESSQIHQRIKFMWDLR